MFNRVFDNTAGVVILTGRGLKLNIFNANMRVVEGRKWKQREKFGCFSIFLHRPNQLVHCYTPSVFNLFFMVLFLFDLRLENE